jgi:hypothetical protein
LPLGRIQPPGALDNPVGVYNYASRARFCRHVSILLHDSCARLRPERGAAPTACVRLGDLASVLKRQHLFLGQLIPLCFREHPKNTNWLRLCVGVGALVVPRPDGWQVAGSRSLRA